MLTVVVIIGIIAGFGIPALKSLVKGSSLSRAANVMVDEMSRARQHAISKNRVVEVRFYRFADPEVPGERTDDPNTGSFRAFQCFEIPTQQINGEDVPVPIGKFIRFPNGVIMNDSDELSTLIGPTSASLLRTSPGDSDPDLPGGVGKNYQFLPFRFLPDGTTSLPLLTIAAGSGGDHDKYGHSGGPNTINGHVYGSSGQASNGGSTVTDALWYITVHSLADKGRTAQGQPPPNFFTWMIDPVAGTSKVFRSFNQPTSGGPSLDNQQVNTDKARKKKRNKTVVCVQQSPGQ